VGVDVDPAGRDDEARGVDLAPGRPLHLAHGHDPLAIDRDVAREALAADDQVVHRILPDHMFFDPENPTAPRRK
jgi:hypothetical protein